MYAMMRSENRRRRLAVRKQEDHVAKVLEFRGRSRRQPASGSIPGLKADASTAMDLVEAKQTWQNILRVQRAWFEKIDRESAERFPMLHFRWHPALHGPEDWWVVPDWVFRSLKEAGNWKFVMIVETERKSVGIRESEVLKVRAEAAKRGGEALISLRWVRWKRGKPVVEVWWIIPEPVFLDLLRDAG